jgi:hypothetical protein
MTANGIVTTAACDLYSIRKPHYAFVDSNSKLTVYNFITEGRYIYSLAGHDLTSMITTSQSVLIGTAKGTFVQIAHDRHEDDQEARMEVRSIKNIKEEPLYLFGADGCLLCVGVGWEESLGQMRCNRVAMVWREEPYFLPLPGIILAHQFDSRNHRQLFVMTSERPAQYLLKIVSFDADRTPVLREEQHTLDMHSIFSDGFAYWSVQAVSGNCDVAFVNGGVLNIVNPTRDLIKERDATEEDEELLFLENAERQCRTGFSTFAGEEDTILVYGTIAGQTSLRICIAEYCEYKWRMCMSFIWDAKDELGNASLLTFSILRDWRESDQELVIKLLSERISGEKTCTLAPFLPSREIKAWGAVKSGSLEVKYTKGISLNDVN